MRLEDFLLHSVETQPYRIRMAIPQGAAPDAGWPVVYLLGDDGFDIAAALIRYHAGCRPPGYMDNAVLVGIGYPERNRRRLDYTPSCAGQAAAPHDAACPADAEQGGAAPFLRFLQHTLREAVARRAPIDARRATLAGHSLGGLFTLHACFTARPGFASYIASSPSVWWGDQYLQRSARAFAAATDIGPTELIITVGEYEQEINPLEVRQQRPDLAELRQTRAQRNMVDGSRALSGTLAQHPMIDVGFQVLEGQSHRSAWPLALHHGLMRVLRSA